MKPIKKYVSKIEALVAEQSLKQSKPRSKGLLSSSSVDKNIKTDDKQNNLDVIAKFVYGIRTAKEEMINGNK